MKKTIGAGLLLCLIFISTGCMRVYGNYTVNEDGTVTATSKSAILKSYVDEMGGASSEAVLETLEDGQQYYSTTETATGSVEDIIESPNVTMTKDIFYYSITPQSDETIKSGYDISDAISQSIYVKLTVTLTSDIVDTNANLTEETIGKTAAFDTSFTGASWYAYTAHGKELIDADTTAPTITGVTEGGYYELLPNIDFSDDTAVASTTINGKPYALTSIVNGKNIVTATDIKGNTSTTYFYVDTKAPTIKGIKDGKTYSGKITFYVKDNLNLSKVTVNGKNIKLGKSKLVKKGKYKNYYKITVKKKGKNTIIAKDSAGNKIKIKIKLR